jgi:hypothetical protein
MCGVRPAVVVKEQVASDLLVGLDHALATFEVDLFVFEAAQEPIHEYFVLAPADGRPSTASLQRPKAAG